MEITTKQLKAVYNAAVNAKKKKALAASPLATTKLTKLEAITKYPYSSIALADAVKNTGSKKTHSEILRDAKAWCKDSNVLPFQSLTYFAQGNGSALLARPFIDLGQELFNAMYAKYTSGIELKDRRTQLKMLVSKIIDEALNAGHAKGKVHIRLTFEQGEVVNIDTHTFVYRPLIKGARI